MISPDSHQEKAGADERAARTKGLKMAIQVLREEIVMTADGEQFEVETRGELNLMPRAAQTVFADFGMFERTSERTVLYTMGCEEMDIISCDSHYLDDLKRLHTGNVEIIDRR